MFKLGRKEHSAEVDVELPLKMEEVLEILSQEPNLGIKGGYAKVVLGELLIEWRKLRHNRAFGNSSRAETETDLDLVLTFFGTRKANIEPLSQRIAQLGEKLVKTEIYLNTADVEARKGNIKDERFVQNFLETRDLTINEVLLAPPEEKGGKWKLFYTDKCFRDTINGAGILAANGAGTVRFDYGRMMTGPYGIIRLIKFLTEKKVKAIYLPLWWIERNNEEAKRLGKEMLGTYGLILTKRYLEKPELQVNFMRIMNELELTDIKNFSDFRREQETFYKFWTRKNFEFNENRTFAEIQSHLAEKEEQRQAGYTIRKQERAQCSHLESESFKCQRCEMNCTLVKCKSCTNVLTVPQGQRHSIMTTEMLCNSRFISANFYQDEIGFYPFYPGRKVENNASNKTKMAEGATK